MGSGWWVLGIDSPGWWYSTCMLVRQQDLIYSHVVELQMQLYFKKPEKCPIAYCLWHPDNITVDYANYPRNRVVYVISGRLVVSIMMVSSPWCAVKWFIHILLAVGKRAWWTLNSSCQYSTPFHRTFLHHHKALWRYTILTCTMAYLYNKLLVSFRL